MSIGQICWQDATEGMDLPVMMIDVTYKMAILHVAGGWDYMPGHHEPAYARRQGVKDIFLNTLFHQSMVDRTICDWAGPLTFLTRRKIAMTGQIYPGDKVTGTGRVVRVWRAEDGSGRVDVDVKIRSGEEVVCTAECTVRLPDRGGQ